IGVAACDNNEIALELAFVVDGGRAVYRGPETKVLTEFCEERAFGENFCGGCGSEHFVGIERVDDGAGGQIVELDAEVRALELRTVDDFLYGSGDGGILLGKSGLRKSSRAESNECAF